MADESTDQGDTKNAKGKEESREGTSTVDDDDMAEESEEESDDEEEDEDEPKLKYARLTSHLAPVYRNGDATSCFMVAGDKMVGSARIGILGHAEQRTDHWNT